MTITHPTPTTPAQCPRCRGRAFLESDRYGSYLSCLLCGWEGQLVSAPDVAPLDERAGPGRHREARMPQASARGWNGRICLIDGVDLRGSQHNYCSDPCVQEGRKRRRRAG